MPRSGLAGLYRWRFVASRVFLGLGIAAAVFYWYLLTSGGGSPVDVLQYIKANPDNLYPHPELLNENGYNYSPAFELVIGWGRLLPFDVFVAIFRAILLVTLVWLAGPLTLFVLFLPPVASEVNAANIQFLLAAAIVLSFRKAEWWGATWSFVLLTKVSPGIGLLWFALRGWRHGSEAPAGSERPRGQEWRKLAWAIGFTGAIVILTFAIWPDRWFGWFRLLTAGSPPPVSPYFLSLWVRLPFALGFVVLGAWRGWRWPVVVAATLALPVFFFLSPSMLVGVLPFLREATGRWLDGLASPPANAMYARRRHSQLADPPDPPDPPDRPDRPDRPDIGDGPARPGPGNPTDPPDPAKTNAPDEMGGPAAPPGASPRATAYAADAHGNAAPAAETERS